MRRSTAASIWQFLSFDAVVAAVVVVVAAAATADSTALRKDVVEVVLYRDDGRKRDFSNAGR